MSWIDTLDRLITDSWMASRDESAAMLDALLALSLAERWDLFVTRDSRLMFLSDEDYSILFRSLNAHAVMAQIGDAHADPAAVVTEEATSVLPDPADFEAGEECRDEGHYEHEQEQLLAEPAVGVLTRLRRWWDGRKGLRWLTLGIVTASALMLVGAFLTVVVLWLLPSGSRTAAAPVALIDKLDEVERDQAQLAKRVIQVDNRVGDLAGSVDRRFGVTLRAVALTSAFDQLQGAVERGGPFTAELRRVAPAVHGDATLEALVRKLDDYAAGVPSVPALRDRFAEIAPRLGGMIDQRDQLSARAVQPGDTGSALDRLLTWVGSAFGLADSADTKRFRAALGGVHATLGLGDLASAVRQIEALHPWPAELVGTWLAAARLRLDLDASMAALRQAAPTTAVLDK